MGRARRVAIVGIRFGAGVEACVNFPSNSPPGGISKVVQLKGRGLDYPYGKPPMVRLPFMPDPIAPFNLTSPHFPLSMKTS